MAEFEFTCPCCGHLVFSEPPGSYGICRVCCWEDDDSQLADPYSAGGANGISLAAAQENVRSIGVCAPEHSEHVVPAGKFERDARWRPLDAGRDRLSRDEVDRVFASEDVNELYYWLQRPSC